MNVVAMVSEILFIANSVIGKSWLPDFSFSTEDGSERVRIAAFDQLNSVLQCYVICGSDQEMNMFGHEDEGGDLKSPFAAMSEEGLKEEADIVLDNKESTTLPSREGDEISSGRRDESSRLQEQTSAAESHVLCLA
jgi:hypothetical protein